MRNPIVYHGSASSKSFPRFSTEHIGSGEGNACYGWGLYFSSLKEVAEWYKSSLGQTLIDGKEITGIYNKKLQVSDGTMIELPDDEFNIFYDAVQNSPRGVSFRGIKEYVKSFIKETKRHYNNEDYINAASSAEKLYDRLTGGRLYTAKIPDGDRYLDWEYSLKDQSLLVRKAIRALFIELLSSDWYMQSTHPYRIAKHYEKWHASEIGGILYHTFSNKSAALSWSFSQMTGSIFYEMLKLYIRTEGVIGHEGSERYKDSMSAKYISLYFRDRGIIGIRYKADSNKFGHNYVIFDDKHVEIKHHE